MATYRDVSPRRLTGKEESELVEAVRKLEAGEREAERLLAERDRLILEIAQAGARVTDIADVLGLTRSAVYNAMERALGDG